MELSLRIYFEIAVKNLLKFFKIPILACVGILIAAQLFFPTAGLDIIEVCKLLEMFVSLLGFVTLTVLFLPEQDKTIFESVVSRKVNRMTVIFIRLLLGVFILGIFVVGFCLFLQYNECEMSPQIMWGTFASAFFLGSLGFCVAGITGNTINGLLVGMVYYICNYGIKKELGLFFLFRMSAGEFKGKYWLVLGGAVLIASVFVVVYLQKHLVRVRIGKNKM